MEEGDGGECDDFFHGGSFCLSVECPSVAVGFFEKGVGFFVVGDGAILGVVVEGFAGAVGDESEHEGFDHFAGVVEIAVGFEVGFAGGEPLLHEAADGWAGAGGGEA